MNLCAIHSLIIQEDVYLFFSAIDSRKLLSVQKLINQKEEEISPSPIFSPFSFFLFYFKFELLYLRQVKMSIACRLAGRHDDR